MGAHSNEEERPDVLPLYYEDGGYSRRQEDRWTPLAWLCGILTALVAVVCLSGLVWIVYQLSLSPEYTVTITSVSGLTDPVTDPKQGSVLLLNPVFNLTVGITSKSMFQGACIDPKTVIKLSYSFHDLPLATGDVPDMCVGPLQLSDRPVVASGSQVPMPGFLIDTLAKEISSGEALFHAQLYTYRQEQEGDQWSYMLSRWVEIGDAVARRPGATQARTQSATGADLQ